MVIITPEVDKCIQWIGAVKTAARPFAEMQVSARSRISRSIVWATRKTGCLENASKPGPRRRRFPGTLGAWFTAQQVRYKRQQELRDAWPGIHYPRQGAG